MKIHYNKLTVEADETELRGLSRLLKTGESYSLGNIFRVAAFHKTIDTSEAKEHLDSLEAESKLRGLLDGV